MWKYGINWAVKITLWFSVMFALFGVAVMYLWNWLVPVLFNGAVISFWQAIGLILLVRFLVGFGKRGPNHIKRKLSGHWTSMSEDEKERLREHFKSRWCRPEESTTN